MNELEDIKTNINATLKEFNDIKETVQDCCARYMDLHEHTEMLDSLLFQSRLIELEYDEIIKSYKFIDNRMYGDYYKLLHSILSYMKQKNTKYPIYKDLDPYKVYDFLIVKALYEDILKLIQKLEDDIQKNENEIVIHRLKLTTELN